MMLSSDDQSSQTDAPQKPDAFISQAQSLEDISLFKTLRDVSQGRYLDIGAFHPEYDSVSAEFYRRGWRGISVDPVPGLAERYAALRPDETFIEAAVTALPGPVMIAIEPGAGTSHILDDSDASGDRTAETITLAALFDRLDGPIHWLKIDVEGHEAQVIESWGDHAARPWILCIEDGADAPSYEADLRRRGYNFIRHDGLNRFYLHESQEARRPALSSPPSVLDDFRIGVKSGLSDAPAAVASLEAERDSVRAERDHLSRLLADQDKALVDYRYAIEAGDKAQAALRLHIANLEAGLVAPTPPGAAASAQIDQLTLRHVERLDAHVTRLEKQLKKRGRRIAKLKARLADGPISPSSKPNDSAPQRLRALETQLDRQIARQEIMDGAHRAGLAAIGAQFEVERRDAARILEERQLAADTLLRQDAHVAHQDLVIRGLEARERHLVEELDRHRAAMEGMRRSVSWRLGAPYRLASRLARQILGGPVSLVRRLRAVGRGQPRHLKGVLINHAAHHWRRDYKLLRPLRNFVLARPSLGRRLSIRNEALEDALAEVDPFDPQPEETAKTLAKQRAEAGIILPPRPKAREPRPNLSVDEAARGRWVRALRRVGG